MGQKQNTSFASIAHGLVSFKGIKRNAAVIAIVCSLVVQVSADLDSLKKAYMDMKYGMFIHFNMATFEGVQWASPDCDPDMFNPTELDCGQWADAAKAAGMKYMVLTAKHHSGFCLWDSDYTTHDAGSSSWRNGKGDVVKEFADSCRSRGLAVGLYFSIWDRKSGNDPAFIRNQLTELLTNYGTIVMLYFDAWGWYISYDDVPYKPLDDYIKSIQPNCLIVNNDQDHDSNTTDIICYEKGIHPWPDIPDDNKLASETNETMAANNNWFWNSTSSDICDPAEDIIALRNYCHARNTNLLLNVGPNQKGIISDQQLKGLEDTKLFFATVTLPNGGEEIEQGTTYEIEYDNNLDGNVKIELLKGGSVAQVLAASTPSNGIFEWEVPADLDEGSDYKIKVTYADSAALYDESDNTFSVIASVGIDPYNKNSSEFSSLRYYNSKVHFQLPDYGNNSYPVSLKLYNTQGKIIKTLVNEQVKAGCHSIPLDKFPPGIYLVKLEAIDFKKVIAVVLAK